MKLQCEQIANRILAQRAKGIWPILKQLIRLFLFGVASGLHMLHRSQFIFATLSLLATQSIWSYLPGKCIREHTYLHIVFSLFFLRSMFEVALSVYFFKEVKPTENDMGCGRKQFRNKIGQRKKKEYLEKMRARPERNWPQVQFCCPPKIRLFLQLSQLPIVIPQVENYENLRLSFLSPTSFWLSKLFFFGSFLL